MANNYSTRTRAASAITPRNCLRAIRKHTPVGVRCYDNGGVGKPKGTCDRYTVVYTGRYRRHTGGEQQYVGMSPSPFHPQGVGMHGSARVDIDYPSYKHLGKKISFDQLPEDCQKLVLSDCFDLALSLPT